MARSTAAKLSLAVLLLTPFIAVAQTVTSTTKTPVTLSPGPTMQNPEPHGPSGGMPPGTRGGSGVESGTEITPPTTLPKK
jgi:hypothetical protein